MVDEEADESDGVFMLTDGLRDSVAGSTDEMLRSVVDPWMRSEELRLRGWEDVTPEEHLEFLFQLRELAKRVQGEGHRLYMYFAG